MGSQLVRRRNATPRQDMTLADLRETYHEVFGEETRSRPKDFLRNRIAWRLQANEEGDLSERAKRRAAAAGGDLLLVQPPRQPALADDRRKRSVTADTGLRLSRFFGMSDTFWTGLQMDHDSAQARNALSRTLARIKPWPRPRARSVAAG